MIVRGPFNLTWGDTTLLEIESLEIDYSLDSEDYTANSGHVYQIDKARKASVTCTFLATDIATLSAILPQYYKENGETLSNGDIVRNSAGAIDLIPHACDPSDIYHDLEIEACGGRAEVLRFVRTRTVIDNIEISKIRKIIVKFISEPLPSQASVQLVGFNDVSEHFLVDSGEDFLLDNGEQLLL